MQLGEQMSGTLAKGTILDASLMISVSSEGFRLEFLPGGAPMQLTAVCLGDDIRKLTRPY